MPRTSSKKKKSPLASARRTALKKKAAPKRSPKAAVADKRVAQEAPSVTHTKFYRPKGYFSYGLETRCAGPNDEYVLVARDRISPMDTDLTDVSFAKCFGDLASAKEEANVRAKRDLFKLQFAHGYEVYRLHDTPPTDTQEPLERAVPQAQRYLDDDVQMIKWRLKADRQLLDRYLPPPSD